MRQRETERRGSVAQWLVFGLFLYLPISMPWVVLQMYFSGARWSILGMLFRPEPWMILALAVLAWRTGAGNRIREVFRRDRGLVWLLTLGVAFVFWTGVCGFVQGAFAPFLVQSLATGWIFPIALAIVLAGFGAPNLRMAWKGLSLGVGLLTIASLALYLASFGFPNSLAAIFYNRYVRAPQGFGAGVYFARLTLGDYNSAAVFFAAVAAFLLGHSVSGTPRTRSGPSWFLFVGSLVLVYLVYSRGAFLSLLAAGLAGLIALSIKRHAWGEANWVRAGFLLVFLLLAVFPKEARPHWSFGGKSGHGTHSVRLAMWESLLVRGPGQEALRKDAGQRDRQKQDQILTETVQGGRSGFSTPESLPIIGRLDPVVPSSQPKPNPDESAARASNFRKQLEARVGSSARRYLFGVGLGNFGVLEGMSFDTGTHNLYLDAFAAGGAPGFGLFVVFWGILGWRLWSYFHARSNSGAAEAVPSGLSVLLAYVALSVSGAIVNFRLDGLGILLPGCMLWLAVLTTGRPLEIEAGRECAETECVA